MNDEVFKTFEIKNTNCSLNWSKMEFIPLNGWLCISVCFFLLQYHRNILLAWQHRSCCCCCTAMMQHYCLCLLCCRKLKDKSGVHKIIVKEQAYQLLNTNREFFPSFDASNVHKLVNESSYVRPNVVAILYFIRVCECAIRRLAMWVV